MALLSRERAQRYASLVQTVPGDFIEIGVFRGDSFQHIVRCAKQFHRQVHAFDSFYGMGEPGANDGKYYPKGQLSVGGVDHFQKEMRERDIANKDYKCWPGFIPNCFEGFDYPVALAFVDVDQYLPTKVALAWTWRRLSSGGILICDDYFRGRAILAAKAIDEFVRTLNVLDATVLEYIDSQLVIMNHEDRIPVSKIDP